MNNVMNMDYEETDYEQLELLEAIEKDLGVVPDFLRLSSDPSLALRAGMGLYDTADGYEYYSANSRLSSPADIFLGSL